MLTKLRSPIRAAALAALLAVLLLSAASPAGARNRHPGITPRLFFGQWSGNYMGVPVIVDVRANHSAHVYSPGDASLNYWYRWRYMAGPAQLFLIDRKTGHLRSELTLRKDPGATEYALIYAELSGPAIELARRH